jgi:hypothetical protein
MEEDLEGEQGVKAEGLVVESVRARKRLVLERVS